MGIQPPRHNVPPQSIESEQSLIGALLLRPQTLDDVLDVITPNDFYSNNHRLIYQAILRLEESNENIDVVTVSDALKDNIEQVGGLVYVGQLANNTPGTTNIGSYARIIRDKAIERGLLEAALSIEHIVHENSDTREKADRSEAAILGAVEERGTTDAVMLHEVSASVIDRLDARMATKGGITGLATGFDRIDKRLSGLQKGNLIVVAGRPSMGKTTYALNIAEHVTIESGGVAVVFSLEMGRDELADKTTCKLARVDNNKFKNGLMSSDELTRITDGIAKQQGVKMIIDDTGDITALQIKSRARKIKRKHGLDLIVIDYLQLMNITHNKGENLASAIGRVTRQLKIAAKELDVPIILLSQLNRSLESRADKRPMMSDLRESGAIEQDADIIMFVYRDSQYNDKTIDEGLAEIITAKYRNGQTGTDTLEFEGRFSCFSNTPKIAVSKDQKDARHQGGFN